MSLTLQDLRVQTQHNLLMTGAANPTRPASLADLVEVLKQEGAEITETMRDNDGYPMLLPDEGLVDGESWLVMRLGVLPLGDTPPSEDERSGDMTEEQHRLDAMYTASLVDDGWSEDTP